MAMPIPAARSRIGALLAVLPSLSYAIRPRHSREVRVAALLAPGRRGGAVTGVDDGIVWQGEQLRADALQQRLAVAAGEVEAADAAAEKHVAAQHRDRRHAAQHEHDVAGRVP